MGQGRQTTTLAIYTRAHKGHESRVLDALAAFSLPTET